MRPAAAKRLIAAALLLAATLANGAAAQGAARAVEVEIGFRGAVVADAWNPLRVTLRDVGAGRFRLDLDVGSLLQGEIPWVIEFPFEGGPGVSVLESDIYLPPWRRATWVVEAGGVTVASGSWARDRAVAQPVTLVVGATDAAIPGGRRIDVDEGSLPARTAAYDGVEAVIVAGDAAPDAEALAAAAVAGAQVALSDAALRAEGARVLLGDREQVALGAGGVTRGWGDATPWPRSARLEALEAFLAESAPMPPAAAPWGRVLAVVAGYLAALWLSLRIGGAPGGLTAVLAFAAALAFAQLPDEAGGARLRDGVQERTRTFTLAGGPLAQRLEVSEVFRLAPGGIERAGFLRPIPLRSASFTLGERASTRLLVGGARAIVLVGAPQATLAPEGP